MSRIRGIRRLLHIDRSAAAIEHAVDDELRFHFEMTVRNLMVSGMSPEDARREAARRFGDLQRTRETLATIDRARAGSERRAEWWSAFVQDLRYALRGLRLKPGFAAAVIVTLGLGIGANATMFEIVDRLMFRPPSFLRSPDRVARVYRIDRYRAGEEVTGEFGYRRYLDFLESTRSFDAMTPFYTETRAVGDGESTREIGVGASTADLWKLFDVTPVIGRLFTEDENRPPDGSRVTVLSYWFWQTEYGGRRDVIGSSIRYGSRLFTIIGVAPDGFNGFATPALAGFVPISALSANMGGPKDPWYATYNSSWFDLYARLKPGVSRAAADADLSRAYVSSYIAEAAAHPNRPPPAMTKKRAIAGPVLADRGPLADAEAKVAVWLVGVAAIVLLIACANVANLLVARSIRRRREIAVRLAMGVSRGRLLSQLLIESTVLTAFGGVAGLAIAQWGGASLRALLLTDMPATNAWASERVLLFSAVLVLVTGVITGLGPALRAARTDIGAALKAGSRNGTVQRSRLRVGLLIMQAALSVALLVGAGLFMRSLANVQHTRLGFDYDRLVLLRINSRGVRMDSVQRVALLELLRDRARQIPGVEGASLAVTVPFSSTWELNLYIEGIDSVSKLGGFTLQAGSPDLLATMGTRVLRGRTLSADDRAGAPRVAVVNQAMANRLWLGQDALGKCMRVGADTAPCTTVVGIAEDIRRRKLGEAEYHYYMPVEQFGNIMSSSIFIRTRGEAAPLAESVRRGLQPLMPGVSYVTVTPMSTTVGSRMRSWKLGATMFAVFGGLALVLAAIGLYSVIAYNVMQRKHELGVRVALGAQSGDVVSLIVREGLQVVMPGVAIGVAVSLVAGKWLAPLLFEVSPKDATVMVSVVGTLMVVAVAASWIPALRASRVDPNEALRAE